MEQIIASNEYFPLLELLPELQGYLATTSLDPASRLSLALTSKALYANLRKCAHCGCVWDFLEDCVRLDYLNLLKYAYENGARVDQALLELAVRVASEELVLWLVEKIQFPQGPTEERMRIMSRIAALRGYWQFLQKLETGTRTEHIGDYEKFKLAAEGGHREQVQYYLQETCLSVYQNEAIKSAARGGHLGLALTYCHAQPTVDELQLILKGGLRGSDLNSIRFALERGAILSPLLGDRLYGIPSALFDLDCAKFLWENVPNLEDLLDKKELALAFAYQPRPTVELLRFLMDHNIPFDIRIFDFSYQEERFGSIICRGRLWARIDRSFAESTFECVKCLISCQSITLRNSALVSSHWATLEMIKWLLEKDNKDQFFWHRILTIQVTRTQRARLDLIEHSLSEGARFVHAKDALEAFLLDNAVEVLNLVVKYRTYGSLDHVLRNNPNWSNKLAKSWSDILEDSENNVKVFVIARPQGRVNVVKWIELLSWLKDHDLIRTLEQLECFLGIDHKYFQFELALLIDSFERGPSPYIHEDELYMAEEDIPDFPW